MASARAEPLSPVSYHLLLSLAGRDRHGYGMKKAVERQGGPRLGPGTLYAAIRRLEDDGLIAESAWRPEADLDDERRRYYRLTAAGRTSLAAETERLSSMVRLARRELGLAGR
jgi:DNA-binding PadR family transcriptional regulator